MTFLATSGEDGMKTMTSLEKMERALESFTNTLLTRFPTAKIAYAPNGVFALGCIGSRTPFTEAPSVASLPRQSPFIRHAASISGERKTLEDGNSFFYSFLTRYLEVSLQKII